MNVLFFSFFSLYIKFWSSNQLIEMVIFACSFSPYSFYLSIYSSIVDCGLFPTSFTLISNAAIPTLLHDPVHIHQSFCWVYTQKWNYWDLGIKSWILLVAVSITWKLVYHVIVPRPMRKDTISPTCWQLLRLSDFWVFANVLSTVKGICFMFVLIHNSL